jgi:hypothetical protein
MSRATARLPEHDLRRELSEYRDRYPKLGDDELFVLWFLRAFVTESEEDAASALSGGPRDKSVDAVLIDESARIVFIVQGKYRKALSKKSEHRGDVIGFAQLAPGIYGDSKTFGSLVQDMSPEVSNKLEQARNRISKRGYALRLFYVTLGKSSEALQGEADRIVRSADAKAAFQLFDGKRVMLLLRDYFDGVAPPVPSLDLEIESGSGVTTTGIFDRYDSNTDIEAWAFSMSDLAVKALYDRAGIRLFARNVRGFLGLGSKGINERIKTTLEREPEYFWYYNNGITIVCDDAKEESSRGQKILRVTNPQVINGQQTTRILAQTPGRGSRANVLVRVIRVPREGSKTGLQFETLVSNIVRATNSQNPIRPSDLVSNDRRQIEIDRQLRNRNYHYMRKRMTKGEFRRAAGMRHWRIVKKDEFAQVVAGCDLDPAIVREGKENLFDHWYGQIFPTADPRYYLTRYWLNRGVSYCARGHVQRAYAKWLVLNFMWLQLEPHCRARASAEAFVSACERNESHVVRPLHLAIGVVYREVLRFYRSKRGTGQQAVDVSAFFQRHNNHKEFAKYWRGSNNESRAKFGKAWPKFEKALLEKVEE